MFRLIIINILLLLFYEYIHTQFICPEHIEDEFLPDPDDCRIFYRCFSGQQARFSCGPGTAFNPSTISCDWPSRVECKTNTAKNTSEYRRNYNIRPSISNIESSTENSEISEIYWRNDKRYKKVSENDERNSYDEKYENNGAGNDHLHYLHSYNYNKPKENINQYGYSEQPSNRWNHKNTHQTIKPNNEYQSINNQKQTFKQEIPNKESIKRTENDYQLFDRQKQNLDKSLLEKREKQENWSGHRSSKLNETFRTQEDKMSVLRNQNERWTNRDPQTWSENTDESRSFRPTMNPWDKRILDGRWSNKKTLEFPTEMSEDRNQIESRNKVAPSEEQSINVPHNVHQKHYNLNNQKNLNEKPEMSSSWLYPLQPKNKWLYPAKKENDQTGPFNFDDNDNKEYQYKFKYRNDYHVNLPEHILPQSIYQQTMNPHYGYNEKRFSKLNPNSSNDYFMPKKSENVEEKSDTFWPLKPREKWSQVPKEYAYEKSKESYASKDFDHKRKLYNQNSRSPYIIDQEKSISSKDEDSYLLNNWWRDRVRKREDSDLKKSSNEFYNTYKSFKNENYRNKFYPLYETNLKMDIIDNSSLWNSKNFTEVNMKQASSNLSDLMEYLNLEFYPGTNEIIFKLTEKDPYAVQDLMSNIKCSELNREDCECEQLSWLKFPKILLNSTIHETITTFYRKEERMKSCFRRCEEINCVAFSLNKLSRVCHLYKGPVHVQEVVANNEFETVIKEPTTTIFGDQWLLINNSIPIGKPLLILRTNNKLECVKLCVETFDCRVSAFMLNECLLYDAINGEKLALQANSTTIQHRSIHEKDNKWQFKHFHGIRLNGTIPMYSFAIRDEQECFDDCLSRSDCLFISIESMLKIYRPGFKECHIYNSLSTYTDDNNFESYLLQIPRNSHYFLKMPNIEFYGSYLLKRKTTLEKCLKIAKYTLNSIKVTHQDNECRIYSDSANIRYVNDKSINSFLITIPSKDEYIRFKRLTGLTLNFTHNNIENYEYVNDLSASFCLSKCLKTLNCAGVSAKYHGTQLFCIYLAEDDIRSPKFIFSLNSELFVKIISKSDSQCSNRSHTRSSNENLNEFEHHFTESSKKLRYSENYDEDNYIMPHDHNFHGMQELDKLNYDSKRTKRSTYASTIEGAKIYKILTEDYNVKPYLARNEAGSHINYLMQGWLSKPLPEQDYYLLQQFIFNIENRLAQKKDELLESMINSAIRARRERGLVKKCKQINRYGIREGFCSESEMCLTSPSIAYSELENDCMNIRVNSTCPIHCRFGYIPTSSHVTCESIGLEAIWNTKNVACVPDIKMCSQFPWIVVAIDNAFKKNRTNYIVKYGEKSPIFSLYYHSILNSFDNSVKPSQLLSLQCPEIRFHQASYLNYKKSPYVPGFLASPNSFKFSQKAYDSTHYFFNTAPQDPYSEKLWKILQSKIDDYLKTFPGFVVSGVCSKKLKDERNISSILEVPACFWKIVCIKINGEVSAAAFFHENTLVYNKEDKHNRLEQVLSYTNQDFINGLIEDEDYVSIWKEAIEKYNLDSDDIHFVRQCSNEKRVNPRHLKYWNQILSQEENDWNEEIEDNNYNLQIESSLSSSSISPSSQLILSTCDKKLVGYIGLGSKIPKVNSLTHLILLSSVQILPNGRLALSKNHSKIYNKIYQLKSLKKDNPQLKVLFGLGGWNNSQYFSNIARDSKIQKNFVSNVLGLLDYWDFDGIDIIWQYPVVGGNGVSGSPDDRLNFVKLLHSLRISLLSHSQRRSREPLILTISTSGMDWIMEGYDLHKISRLVDWINVLAFDYFGPWNSTWGTYTGPISALYHGAPDGFPGKLNVHSTIKKYVCDTLPDKIVLGISVFGRYWTSVDDYADKYNKNPLYRRMRNGKGGFIPYRDIVSKWLKEFKETFDNNTKTSYLWSEKMKTLVSYESSQSLAEKVKYASNYGLGGIALWSIDMDSEDDNNSLYKVIENLSCVVKETFSCNPIKERRFWTQYDDDGKKDRMCGKVAPLINGYYPICDTYDSGYSCCSSKGYCGSGEKFCKCNGCINYGKNASEVIKHSTKPYMQIEWLTLDLIEPMKPVCGPKAPRLHNGRIPICNPEDENGHCCSAEGYCGTGPKFCECKNCHDFSLQI